jgi:hypothetical protein
MKYVFGGAALAALAFLAGVAFPHPLVLAEDTVCTAVADLGATDSEKLDRLLAISREIYLSLNVLPDNGNIE